jgi:ribosomal protein L5
MSDKQKEFIFNDKTYVIESDIERAPSKNESAPWKRLYESMEIGDSVLLTRREAYNFLSLVNSWIVGGKSRTRKISVRKVDEDRARAWKIQ